MSLAGWRLTVAWPLGLVLAPVLLIAGLLFERRAQRGAALRRRGLLRGGIIVALALAVSRPLVARGGAAMLVVLADRSTSVAAGAVDQALAALGLPHPGVTLLPFGDGYGSPLADALGLAARALPGGGRVIVLSDGAATGADPVPAAGVVAASGVQVDVWPLPARGGPDAAVRALDVPSAWRAGDVLPVTVSVRATAPLTGTLALQADGVEVVSAAVVLGPGLTTLRTPYLVRSPGDLRLRAVLSVNGDTEPGNDVAFGVVHVAPPPRLLVVGDGPAAVSLSDTLAGEGFTTVVLAPERMPVRLSALEAWDALVLVDVPAGAMGLDQLAAVEAFAADMGRGVVFTGGRQSYLPGGWGNTPLAALAPVRLEPPPRGEREAVALLLLIDQSASMGGTEVGGVTKLDLAREAAILSTEVLYPGDRVGVVAYDDEARWLVRLTTVGAGRELAEVEGEVGRLVAGGGTRILRALELGLPSLTATDAATRHALLFTDGRDFNPDRTANDAVVDEARARGVVLSTIAIGSDADRELLIRLAQRGRGRYHSADDPSDLPRLAVQESEIVRARVERRGEFRVASDGHLAHPVLAGVDIAALPPLTGYLAVSRRPGAEVALRAPDGDPLLATWQYGLGRVAAWTSDVGEEWASSWAASPAAVRFWSRLVGYVARAPEAGPPGVSVAVSDGAARIAVDARDAAGRTVDLAAVTVVMTGTDGVASHSLDQVAPGTYEANVPVVAPGAYPAAVRVEGSGQAGAVPAGWVVDYPPELAPAGDGSALLAAVAAAGGGKVLEDDQPQFSVARGERLELWPWLVLLAALLWPLDLARQLGVIGPRRGAE